MRLFVIKKGTKIGAIKVGVDFKPENFSYVETKKENVFGAEDIIMDPMGAATHSTMGFFVEPGRYAFKKDGWIMVVKQEYVEVL